MQDEQYVRLFSAKLHQVGSIRYNFLQHTFSEVFLALRYLNCCFRSYCTSSNDLNRVANKPTPSLLWNRLSLLLLSKVYLKITYCSRWNAIIFRQTVLRYARAVNELMMDIGHKIGEGLGLKGIPFKGWPCQFRINKYTFTNENIGSSGVQLHTDSSFLTVLQDDEIIGGLEVMRKSGTFFAIDPCPETLLVNLGDIAAVRKSFYHLSLLWFSSFYYLSLLWFSSY